MELLNDYISFNLGVSFDGKYNSLVIEEILKNKKKYPLIYQFFEEVDLNEKGYEKIEFPPFISDGCDEYANIHETLELYKAFLRVFLDDIEKAKSICIDYIACGIEYLRNKNLFCMFNPYLNYSGYVSLSANELGINVEEYLFDKCKEYHVRLGYENRMKFYYSDTKNIMEETKKSINTIKMGLSSNRFDEKELIEKILPNGEKGYGYYFYKLGINGMDIKLFSTEMGFDGYGAIRTSLTNNLTEEQRSSKILQDYLEERTFFDIIEEN